ncbi:MAG: tRNA guanosine(34) transglycosylase Tgt, partial [Candidatus Taylorbacteria bacterium]|nr:tRNA guanosine(34) transglycosylase Tgt [Candidatus Taylorbacteria bacterium]
MKFSVKHSVKNSRARTGLLTTPHGVVKTPVFMPVATSGAVKTLAPEEVKCLG